MNPISWKDPSGPLDRADNADSPGIESSRHPATERHPTGHLLLCALGMIAALGIGALLGVNVVPLFCAAMMLSMVWMMVGPAIRKRHGTEHH